MKKYSFSKFVLTFYCWEKCSSNLKNVLNQWACSMQAPCLQKRFSDYFWQNRRLLEFLNDDTKLILNNQEGHSDSFRINLESIRTFRGLLFHKKGTGRVFFGSTVFWLDSNASSFYRSQNNLDWSKFFGPDQKFTYILCQSQTVCVTPKDDFHLVSLAFVPAQ